MILILSSGSDAHALAVLSRIESRGGTGDLLDLSSFPHHARLTIQYDGAARSRAVLRNGKREIDFRDCRVVWWRRPQPFGIHPDIADPDAQNFAFSEAHQAFTGLWLTLDAFWINHPTRDEVASHKVLQLELARDLGLRVPETCITSDPTEARRFVEACGAGGTIYKAFAGSERAWRETRLLAKDELALIDRVEYAPVIFQEYIPAEVDLRITVVGDRIFPAAIHSQETSYKVDFRMTMEQARFEEHQLPAEVTRKLFALMKRLGLVYGAIDMRRTPQGEYVFLEINPAGQWLFVEDRTALPISDAMAELMLEKDR